MKAPSIFPSLTLSLAAVILSASPAWSEVFADNFDREGSEFFNPDASASVGTGYVLSQTGETGTPTAAIQSNQAWIGRADKAPAGNCVLRYEGLALPDSGKNSFQLELDVTTIGVASNSSFYGLAFNYQASGAKAGSFYAARLCNGGNVEIQILKISPAGVVSNVVNVKNSAGLELNATYHLTITSSAIGIFDYALTGPGIEAGSLTGTYRDATPLSGGFAGLYTSSAAQAPKVTDTVAAKFDNFSISINP